MIDLAALASLHADFADDLAHDVGRVAVGDEVVVADGAVTVMGVVNLSPDSTYRESVAPSTDAAVRLARAHVVEGATIVDLGAEASHAAAQRVSAQDQIDRLVPVVRALAPEMAISVETYHARVVEAVLDAGAHMINLTGRSDEDEVLSLVAEAGAGLLMVYSPGDSVREPAELPMGDELVPTLIEHFEPRLESARAAGVHDVVVDPGSGFTYSNLSGTDKARVQSRVLAQSMRLRSLGAPCGHALPHCFDLFGREFRHAEGYFTVLAALGRAHLLRVHEVARVCAVLRSMESLAVR